MEINACTCRPSARYCECGATQEIAQRIADALDALDNLPDYTPPS